MASEHVQTLSRCPGTPWSLQIPSCERCPSATSWPGLHPPTPGSDRWRHVRKPGGQRRTWNTAKPSSEIHTEDLREEEDALKIRPVITTTTKQEGYNFIIGITVLTGVHYWFPLVAPLTELLGVLPLHACSLLEACHYVITGLESILCSLHTALIVPRLPGHKEREEDLIFTLQTEDRGGSFKLYDSFQL